MNNLVSALILAGGRSSRMGQDKALVEFQGQPMLRRVYEVASTCCSSVYLLTPWPERYVEILPEAAQVLRESAPHQGPLVALCQGLTQIQTEWVLLLACDLPLLNPTILQDWIEQLTLSANSTFARVPYQNDNWEPLCGFYRHCLATNLQEFIEQGGRSFQNWLDQIAAEPLVVNPNTAQMLHNCNTPADLQPTFRTLKSD
ncbi:MAG: molybdenum cofactor guanylyltransferase [Microcoleaceae cyanobacterium]